MSHLGDIPEEAEVNECAADCAAGSTATTAGNSMLKDLPSGTVYHRSATGKVVLRAIFSEVREPEGMLSAQFCRTLENKAADV